MKKITIYQKPACATCRKVYNALKENGADFTAVNYYTEPLSKSKIKSLLSKMNISAGELLRTKEPAFKKWGLGDNKYTEAKAIDLMAQYPDLIQRPIVEMGTKAILARPAERILEILPAPSKKA